MVIIGPGASHGSLCDLDNITLLLDVSFLLYKTGKLTLWLFLVVSFTSKILCFHNFMNIILYSVVQVLKMPEQGYSDLKFLS